MTDKLNVVIWNEYRHERRGDGASAKIYPEGIHGYIKSFLNIEDELDVTLAALDLPLHELGAIVNDPANGGFAQAGRSRVFLCPSDHALGGIHMANGGSCLGGGQCCAAGIGKEVQHTQRTARLLDLGIDKVPVGPGL